MNKFSGLGLFTQWTITAAETGPDIEGTPFTQYEQWGSYKPNPVCRASLEVLISQILNIWRYSVKDIIWRYSGKDRFIFVLLHFISSYCGWSLRWRECWENMWTPDVPAYFGLRGAFWTWISQMPPHRTPAKEEIKFAQAFPKKSGCGGSAQPSTHHYRALQTYIEI